MDKLKIGYVGVSIPSYFADEYKQSERAVAGLSKLAEELDFDLHAVRKTAMNAEDAEDARRELVANRVDFLMLENAGCSQGQQLIPLSKVCSRMGLWATPEPRLHGDIQIHSLVSMSMYASIMKTYLAQYNIPYKWFYGQPGDEMFDRRFRVTVKALKAMKTLSQSKVGWIGGLSPGFYDMIFDERKLERRFGGLRVFTHELMEIVQMAKRYDESKVGATVSEMKAAATSVEVPDDAMARGGRTYMALKELAAREGYNALAVECWPKFQAFYGLAPCMAYSWLGSEDGMAVACEGDVLGAVSMLMLNQLSDERGSSTLLDIASLDQANTGLQLWHCGVSPRHFANAAGIRWVEHPTIGRKSPGEPRFGVSGDQVFAAGRSTVSYVGRDGDTLLVMNSEIEEKPETPGFIGTRGWFSQFKLNQEPIEMWDLMNTLTVHGQEHHYAVAHGDVSSELLEIAAWLKMDPIKRVPYKDYLQLEDTNG